MPKTSDVKFTARVNIGSGMTTAVYSGEVAAVRSAVDAAVVLSGEIGELAFSNVIPRPHVRIVDLIDQRSADQQEIGATPGLAVGMVEASGFTPMIQAADSGIKAADVLIPSWVTVGSGLTTVFFRGSVAAVHSAVESAVEAAAKMGSVAAVHVIARPHPGTEEIAPVGAWKKDSIFSDPGTDSALGILETRGITGLVEGMDAGLKAASVTIQGWEKIGKGMTSVIFRGAVADVRTALEAAKDGAGKVGSFSGSYMIARPHEELEKGR
jgi:microcompartment protein CcmL/EutN